jgi:hypothetical protein
MQAGRSWCFQTPFSHSKARPLKTQNVAPGEKSPPFHLHSFIDSAGLLAAGTADAAGTVGSGLGCAFAAKLVPRLKAAVNLTRQCLPNRKEMQLKKWAPCYPKHGEVALVSFANCRAKSIGRASARKQNDRQSLRSHANPAGPNLQPPGAAKNAAAALLHPDPQTLPQGPGAVALIDRWN